MSQDDKNMPESGNVEKNSPAIKRSFGAKLRGYFLAGVLVTVPISLTFYLVWIFIKFTDHQVASLVPEFYNPESDIPFGLPGIGVVVVAIVMIFIGALTAGFLGRLFHRIVDNLLARLPVVRGVHSAIKQILQTVFSNKSNAFREAVLVEYPRRGIWAIAFITGRTQGEVQNLTVEECINIFIPTTPNPTSGFLLFVPKKDLVPLGMAVDDALKMVISGGIITPPDERSQEEQDTPQISATTYEDMDILREENNTPILVTKESNQTAKT
jgi:uncharacterized membrane protein